MNKKLLLGLLLTSFVGSGCAAQGGDEPSKSSQKRRAELQPEGIEFSAELYNACKNGHIKVVTDLLKRGTMAEINAGVVGTYRTIETPFCVACIYGYTEIVKAFLESEKVNINAGKVALNGTTETPFYAACFNGHAEAVKALLESGKVTDINAGCVYANGSTITPFFAACASGHAEVVKALLEKLQRADINKGMVRANGTTITPFSVASMHGHKEVMALFAKK